MSTFLAQCPLCPLNTPLQKHLQKVCLILVTYLANPSWQLGALHTFYWSDASRPCLPQNTHKTCHRRPLSFPLLMVHLLAGVLSRTLSYPRFTHAFADLMVIRTSVGNTFPVYLRSWELNNYSHPTSSIKLLGWTQGISPYSCLPSIPMCGFYHPSFGETGRTIRFPLINLKPLMHLLYQL